MLLGKQKKYKFNHIDDIIDEEKIQPRVLIYCRESRDDNMENYDRIETQRDLLIGYCNKKGYTNIAKIIMHDNMTGTDFSRLDDIKDMIQRKEIDVILMKDSSRLGRNQYEALGFIQFLEENSVEIEFYERKYDPELFPLEAYFHERRVRDDSQKIRATLRGKMEKGDFLVRAHYGYIKEGNNLVVDENTSWVVKKIFDLYKEGYGYRKIARLLNDEGIPTPSSYRNNPNRPRASIWIAQHVGRIIKNEVYTGTMISGKTEKVSYKSKKTKRKSEGQWIRIEYNHPALVDKETFEMVQKILKEKQSFAPKAKKPNLFSGFIKCGRCHSSMYIIKKKGRLNSFVCSKYFKEGKVKESIEDRGCTSHRIREADIIKAVESHIFVMLKKTDYQVYFNNGLKDTMKSKALQSNELNKLESSLDRFKSLYEQVYNDKLNRKIPDFIFEKKRVEFDNNIKMLQRQIDEVNNRISNLNALESDISKVDAAIKNIEEKGLSKEAVGLILNKIIVYDKLEITKEVTEAYNLKDETADDIFQNGGVLIDMKYMAQHVKLNGWL